MTGELAIICQGPHSLGEGILWDRRVDRLLWVDIEGRLLHFRDPSGGGERALSGMPGTVVLTESVDHVITAQDDGLYRIDLSHPAEKPERLAPYPEDAARSRFNDGACDPFGNLVVGTMARDGASGAGKLYRYRPDGSYEVLLDGLSIPNGLAWYREGGEGEAWRLYFIDTPTREIRRYAYGRGEEALGPPEVAVRVPDDWGWPDGMSIDAEGSLWVAHWGGHHVVRYDPRSGESLPRIEIPVPFVTSCAFGGPTGQTLYITTALGSSDGGWADRERYPRSGAVFAAEPGVAGGPVWRFGGREGEADAPVGPPA